MGDLVVTTEVVVKSGDYITVDMVMFDALNRGNMLRPISCTWFHGDPVTDHWLTFGLETDDCDEIEVWLKDKEDY